MSELAVSPGPVRASRPLERVESEIVSLASQLAAASARLLALIGEYDAAEGWRDWGTRSLAHWLTWKTGIGLHAAREQVRVARALRDLPVVAASFAAGRLSYSKVRALTRIATARTEKELVAVAEATTGSQMERFAASVRRAERAADVRARRAAGYVTWHQDDDGSIVGSFRLPPEQAAVFCQGLDVAAGGVGELAGEGDPEPDKAARSKKRSSADALELMAQTFLENVPAGTSPQVAERHQLVLHTTVEELAKPDDADDDGAGSLLTGGNGRTWRIAPSTARRLSCDCPASTMIDGPDGDALHLGRKTRRIRGRLRRAVMARDRGMCQTPGCTEPATQIHHLRHWAHGGPTCLRNLVSLCDGHHWLVHEGGFTLARAGDGWVLMSLDGVRIGPHPDTPAPTAPLPMDPAIAPNAITGHWDGSRLYANELVRHIVDAGLPQRAAKHSAVKTVDEDVPAGTWEPIDWPVHDDYPGEPWIGADDPFHILG